MSSLIEMPKLDDLSSKECDQLVKQLQLMQQKVALKQKTAASLDAAISEASARAPAMKTVDACFVIDCTRSMRGVIEAAKEKISEIQQRICSLLGDGGNVRFAIVAYRDHQFEQNFEVMPFTTNLKKVKTFLCSLEAGGLFVAHLDECEDVMGGLSKAMDLEWQAKMRMLYLVCDNPPHGKRFSHPDAKKLVEPYIEACVYDLDPEHVCQWEYTDRVIARSVELRLNFLVLKYDKKWGSMCDKMFEVFAELRKESANCADHTQELQTLAFTPESSAASFVSCILTGTTRSLTQSRTNRSAARSLAGESLAFNVTANICWTDRTWPVYDAFVVHLRVVGLTSDPQRNVVVRKLHVRPEPFAEGAMRYAFPAATEDGKRFVLKVHKSGLHEAAKQCLADVQTQAYAKFFGEAFSQRFPGAPVQFLEAWQVELPGFVSRHATLEPFVEGTYQKYTNNSGFVSDGAKLAEAFSHFTYCLSGGQMMVTDLQGFESSIFTDPQIHCIEKDFFARGNLGEDGMDQFFFGHSCNEVCNSLKLKPHPMQLPLDDGRTSLGSGSSGASSQLLSRGSQICELCNALFKLQNEEYLDAINKCQAVFCADCCAKVDASKLSFVCESCHKEVFFSPYAIAVKGCARPDKCRDCELSEEWMFVTE